MRLVYTADLHGDIAAYTQLLELAATTSAQAVIVGGDLLPHAISFGDALQVQGDFIAGALRELLLRFRTAHPQIAVYLLAGNDDWAAAIAQLEDLNRDGLAFPLHERVYQLDAGGGSQPLWLAGYACVPLTPFSIKDYERRDAGPLPPFSFERAYISASGMIEPVGAAAIAAQPSIGEALAALAQQSDPQRTIYVCHTPPADTALDQMDRGRHPGSQALRTFIEQHAPPLTLHGHIHEAPHLSGSYAIQLGTTWCINPGNDQRRFHAVALDTDDIAGTMVHTVFGKLCVSH